MAPKGPPKARKWRLAGSPVWASFTAGVRGCQGHDTALFPRAAAVRWLPDSSLQRPAMPELFAFISYLLQLYIYILVASAILSWLVAFNVVNVRNPIVAGI